MSTIDGYGAVGNNPNLQSLHDDDAGIKSTRDKQQQAVLSADGLAYLKPGGSAPVPAFAAPPQVDGGHKGKAALQVMHENVRADVNRLSSAWQGADPNLSGPDRGFAGINYSELIDVLVKLDSEQAKASREAHAYQYKEIAATQMQAAADVRKAGQLEFVGAMVSSSMTMAAGAVQIGGAMYAMGSDGGSGGAGPETSGESAETTAETNAGALEEDDAAVSFNQGMEAGEVEGADSTATSNEETGADDTTSELETELEDAAAKAQAGETAGGAGETEASTDADAAAEEELELTEQQDGANKAEDNKGLIDDDTKQIMKQFSKDARVNASAQSSQAKLSMSGGLAQGFQGVGSAGKGVADMGASEYRAKEKEEEALAAEQQAVMQREMDFGKSAEENAKKMMDVYDSIVQSREASMQRVVTA